MITHMRWTETKVNIKIRDGHVSLFVVKHLSSNSLPCSKPWNGGEDKTREKNCPRSTCDWRSREVVDSHVRENTIKGNKWGKRIDHNVSKIQWLHLGSSSLTYVLYCFTVQLQSSNSSYLPCCVRATHTFNWSQQFQKIMTKKCPRKHFTIEQNKTCL